jgi:hypothetical protein
MFNSPGARAAIGPFSDRRNIKPCAMTLFDYIRDGLIPGPEFIMIKNSKK